MIRAVLLAPALLLPALSIGCGSSTPYVPEDPGEDLTTSSGEVRGFAQSPASGSRAAQVTAWQLVGGRLQAASDTASTDENGRYDLALDVLSGQAFFVEARCDDGSTASVLVPGIAAAGDAVAAAPMTVETTGETYLYTTIVASGAEEARDASGAVLRALVDAELAGTFVSADDATRAEVAPGIAAAVAAWESVGDEVADGDAALAALVDLTARADAEGDASEKPVDAATFEAGLRAAWMSAGATSADVSYMAAASLEAWLRFASREAASDAASLSFAERRAVLAAEVVTELWGTIEAEAGVGENEDDVLEVLFDALDDADNGSVNATVAVDAAFDRYARGMADALFELLEPDQTRAVIAAIPIVVEASTEMNASIAKADPEAMGQASADAVLGFRSTVEGDVAAMLEDSRVFSGVQAHAIAELLAQLSVNGGAQD